MILRVELNNFLRYGLHFWSAATYDYYNVSFNIFREFLDSKEIYDLYPDIIADYVTYLRNYRKRDNSKLTNTSINTYLRSVHSFFNWALKNDLVSFDYFRNYHQLKSDQVQIVPLSTTEVYAIDDIFNLRSTLDLRDYLIVHFMLDLGLRSQEVQHLKVNELNFDKNFVVINNSKYNKSRVVPLPVFLSIRTQAYIDMSGSIDNLFIQLNGKPINKNVIRTLFLKIKDKSGVSRVYPHLLRHTFATSYLVGGGNLEFLRLLLGHSSYAVTQKYLHISNQFQIIGSDIYRLDDIYFKKGYN